MIRFRRLADPLCLSGALAAVVWWLGRLGERVPGPPLRPHAMLAWVSDVGATDALFSLLRLGALCASWYPLAILALGALARLTRRRDLVRIVDAFSVGVVRRALDGALALSVTAGSLAVAATPAAWSLLDGPSPLAVEMELPSAGRAPVMHAAPADPGGSPDRGGSAPTMTADPIVAPATSWLAGPGDHLWSIAEQIVVERGLKPTEGNVAAYWVRLIEANRATLVDPGNADLLLPGQTVALPA